LHAFWQFSIFNYQFTMNLQFSIKKCFEIEN